MNSEKVKEIKKALEDNKTDHLPYIDGCKCKFVEYADILTLINELESENAKLLEENESLNGSWKNAIKRIAELEKVYDRQVRIINDLNIEVVKKQEKLPKFAKRLKEQAYDSFGDKVIWYNDIDETLKEFINN